MIVYTLIAEDGRYYKCDGPVLVEDVKEAYMTADTVALHQVLQKYPYLTPIQGDYYQLDNENTYSSLEAELEAILVRISQYGPVKFIAEDKAYDYRRCDRDIINHITFVELEPFTAGVMSLVAATSLYVLAKEKGIRTNLKACKKLVAKQGRILNLEVSLPLMLKELEGD